MFRVDPDAVIIGEVFAKSTRATPPTVIANCKRRFSDYDLATKETSAMEKRKQKRLEAAGWRLGSAAEFLGLSEDEAQLVEMKLALSAKLRTARQQRHWTQMTLAKRLGSSQSRVAKMEAGDPSVTLDLLVRGLLAMGTTPREIARTLSTRAA